MVKKKIDKFIRNMNLKWNNEKKNVKTMTNIQLFMRMKWKMYGELKVIQGSLVLEICALCDRSQLGEHHGSRTVCFLHSCRL